MNKTAKTIAGVERERERERESHNLENQTSILHYALLNVHARDG